MAHRCDLDLHKGNIALEIPNFDRRPEKDVMNAVGLPQCVPVFTLNQPYQSDSLPKYLVVPGSLADCVELNDLRIKIIDLGAGSLQRSRPCHQILRSHSFLQC